MTDLESPVFIWTMQRTGGTSFSNALHQGMDYCETILQEPFNPSRVWGKRISQKCRESDEACQGAIAECLGEGSSVKHCFELHRRRFNNNLLVALQDSDRYRHVVLLRKDLTGRVLSRFIAQVTTVWGRGGVKSGGYQKYLDGEERLPPFPVNQLVDNALENLKQERWLIDSLTAAKLPFIMVEFESLFTGQHDARVAYAKRVFGSLNAELRPDDRRQEKCLYSNRQGTEQLFPVVSNYLEAKKAIDHAVESHSKETWRDSTIDKSEREG